MNKYYNYPLLSHNTFGVDVAAHCFIDYANEDELCEVIQELCQAELPKPVLHIGGGSNLLFLHNFDGVILHSAIKGIEIVESEVASHDEVTLCVGAGEVWDDVVSFAIGHGCYGIENLSLIPGETGAAAVQNIGAYGVEVKDVITQVCGVHLYTGEKRVFSVGECDYAYRSSVFKHDLKGQYAVTHVYLKLSRHFIPKLDYGGIRKQLECQGVNPDKLTAEALRRTIIDIRQAKLPDPKVQGNAGSFFMNPVVDAGSFERLLKQYPLMPHYQLDDGQVKIPAGWLIEQCGWKGKALGRAGVHDKQALVLVNLGGATGDDIVRLSETVQHDVKQKFGIDIHAEVNFIG